MEQGKRSGPVVLVGAGALGSHLALAIRNFEHPLKVVDFDRVEQKNTLAQFHGRMGLRKNKAQALAQSLGGLFGLKVEAVPHKLTDENAALLLGGAALVVDATDNLAAREVLRRACAELALPLLHGALSADGSFARVVWSEWFQPDAESGDGATCEDGENLPFHVLAGSVLALAAQAFLRDGKRSNFQITPAGVVQV